jgi:hypothetical protein
MVMKTFSTLLLAVAVFAGCQNDSKLDSGGGGGGGGALEGRVKKLEEQNAKYAEALEFLQKVYQQQKGQQQQQERDEPDPAAMFAVDVQQSVAAGLVEGPATGAPVTIVEAWDFA